MFRKFILFLFFFSKILLSQEVSQANLNYLNSLPEDIRQEVLNKLSPSAMVQDSNSGNTLILDSKFPSLELEENQEQTERLKNIFGYKFFENQPTTYAPVLDVPLFSDYRLSYLDIIEVAVVGNQSFNFSLEVDLGGSVTIPDIGAVFIIDLNLDEAQKRISERIKQRFVGAEVSVNLKKAQLKKISIIGSVKRPGTYVMNPFVSVSESIKYAGGLIENASLRKVEVRDVKGNQIFVDLYKFLVFGDRSFDRNLKNGDTVVVNASSDFLELEGEIFRPMIYEYLETDTVEDLINFGQGMTAYGKEGSIFGNLIEIEAVETRKLKMNQKLDEKYTSVFVGGNIVSRSKKIKVDGYGVTTGYFDYSEDRKLINLIEKLDFSDEIYPFLFILDQSSNGGFGRERQYLSLFDEDSYSEITLNDNVEIKFFDRNQFTLFQKFKNDYQDYQDDLEEIELEESLMKSQMILTDNDGLNSVAPPTLLTENNTKMKPEEPLVGVDTFDDLENAFAEANILDITIGEKIFYFPFVGKFSIQALTEYSAYPLNGLDFSNVSVFVDGELDYTNAFDKEFIFEKNASARIPLKTSQVIEISILGEVPFPGTFKVSRNTTLQDAYEITGGFNETADSRGIVFSRETIKEKEIEAYMAAKDLIIDSIITSFSSPGATQIDPTIIQIISDVDGEDFVGRVSGDFSFDSYLSNLTILEDGDTITVPSKSNFVSVYGEVMQNSTLVFERGNSIDSYIQGAGGLTRFADRSNIFIIKADGVSVKPEGRVFGDDYNLLPGDTIVVPRNLDKISALPLFSITTQILSDLAIAAASLNAISN